MIQPIAPQTIMPIEDGTGATTVGAVIVNDTSNGSATSASTGTGLSDLLLGGVTPEFPALRLQTCATIDSAIAQVQNQFLTVRPSPATAQAIVDWQTKAQAFKATCKSTATTAPVTPPSSNKLLLSTLVVLLAVGVGVVVYVKLVKK